mmetsp:Transcript_26910/g.4913  ORF Transcript_26910/g.4913 Transcript_26910/m.4913 type:complete len:113 (-) Transcript_26910:1058-1396(-)
MLSAHFQRKFGLLHNLLGVFDTNSTGYIVGTYPPNRSIPEYSPLIKHDDAPVYQTTKLPNGVTITTESTVFPGPVKIAVRVATGSRDETLETSGVSFSLAKTYLKTNFRTNE